MPLDLERLAQKLRATRPAPTRPANPAGGGREAKPAPQDGEEARRVPHPAPARQEGTPLQTYAAFAATGEKEAESALQDGAEACRKPVAAPARQEAAPTRHPAPQDPWRLPPGLELGALSPLRGREAEIAARAKGWELVERIRALDWEQGQEYSRRLNRCPTPEVPALLKELQEVLARLEGERGRTHGR